jgi:hypothetical protein
MIFRHEAVRKLAQTSGSRPMNETRKRNLPQIFGNQAGAGVLGG